METYLSDNKGHRVPPEAGMADCVAASGIKVTCTNAATNYTATVVGGESYLVTATKTAITSTSDCLFLSITGTAVTDANKEWHCPLGRSIVITIPEGVTTLNMAGTLAATVVYLAKLKNQDD